MATTPVDVELRTEFGEVLARLKDPGFFLDILPHHDDRSFACLRFVDPWGDTIFNRSQARELLAELDRIDVPPNVDGIDVWLQQLRSLAERCASNVHLYLRFTGY